MNTLESYETLNPYGKSDECAKFTIEDTSAVFTMADATSVGQLYTFNAWVKGDAEGTFTVLDQEFPITTDWQQCKVTFTAVSEDLTLGFGVTGVYYLYASQLEIGNQATDWTPAVEDVEEDMEDTANEVSMVQRTDIIAECDSLILSAQQTIMSNVQNDYVDKATYDTKMAELEIQADSIDMRFQSNEASMSETESKFAEFYKHISFTENGIIISSGDNAISLRLDNGIIGFYKNDSEEPFGKWDGVDFYTGNIIVEVEERAQLGNFAFVPRSDGSLAFYKVGG